MSSTLIPSGLEALADFEAAARAGGAGPGSELPWPVRSPLPPTSDPVPTMSASMIPRRFRDWLDDVATRVSVPLEFVAVPVVVGLSALVGRTVGIRPMRHDDWLVIPNQWGAIVGPPGVMKSAAIGEATKPLRRLAVAARETHKKALARSAAAAEVTEAKIKAIKGLMADAAKAEKSVKPSVAGTEKGGAAKVFAPPTGHKGHDMATLTADLIRLKEEEETAANVKLRRFETNDTTIEKLGELLNENPRGLLLLRDEIVGFLKGLDRDDRAQDRAFYLESWNGDGSYVFDRIGRGTIHIDALCLAMIGGIQPGLLSSYTAGAIGQREGADGLLARFSLLVWPDDIGGWRGVDASPDTDARDKAFEVFTAIDKLDPMTVGAEVDPPFQSIPALRFAPDAQDRFIEWRHDLEAKLRSSAVVATPAFCQHISKYRKLVPSLALLFHLVNVVGGEPGKGVTLPALEMALKWAEFLELHAKKLYAAELRGDLAAAAALAAKIERGAVADGMTVSEITERDWSGLARKGAVHEAVEVLARQGWLRRERKVTGGRPSDVIRLHPDFRGAKPS